MPNQFVIKKGFHSKADSQVTGALDVSGVLTAGGSVVGAAFPFTGDAQITGSLVVSGSFNAFKLDTNSIILGEQAGANTTSGNTYNVMVGYQAGKENAGGDYNTIVGSHAGLNADSNNNTFIGHLAGGDSLLGEFNVMLGDSAGKSAAGIDYSSGLGAYALFRSTGNYNVGLGHEAGSQLVTGDYNIIIGRIPGDATMNNQLRIGSGSMVAVSASLATGHVIVNSLDVSGEFIPYGVAHLSSSNTAIGSGSGEDMTTGVQNVLIGELAGKDNTIGDGNVMIGFEAGETNTLGDKNVLIGYQAGKNFGTGTASDSNVAIGNKAGMGSGYTDANYNVWIGYQAGIDATSGDSNIGLGFNSLFELKGGSNNIALGYQTGVNISSGDKNVMVGYQAGFKVTTGGNNIFIGYNGTSAGGMGGQTSTANQLRIGDTAVVTISASLATGHVLLNSLSVSGSKSTTNSTTLSVVGSGSISSSAIFEVKGAAGTLFAVNDGLDGELFAANNISGLPVISANADNSVRLGKYQGFGIVISGSTPGPTDEAAKIFITGSIYNTGSVLGIHRPVATHTANFTSSIGYLGNYNIVGGDLTCSIQTSSLMPGAEFEFFQTSSAGNFLFESASNVSLIVKNDNMNLAGQGSGATLKYISGDTFHMVGDLT